MTQQRAVARICLTEEQVLSFVEGRLERPEIALVDAHVGVCGLCSALVLASLSVCPSFMACNLPSARCWNFEPHERVADRYVVCRPLGQGGMGDVYEAFDLLRCDIVALKTVRAVSCDDPHAMLRLSHEARLARRIRHPNVCHVYEDGVHDGGPLSRNTVGFMSMELVRGESLARRLRSGDLPPEYTKAIARELLLAVEAIHRAGVIHRDIKSHNVMLRAGTNANHVSVIDFGLAIDLAAGRAGAHVQSTEPTSFGFEGSPAYMAPEQLRDGVATPGTDVFACGVVLFEAFTGALPFRSLRSGRVGLRRDPNETPLRVSDVAGALPRWVETFVGRCLDLNPTARYVDAEEALAAFDRLAR